MPKRRMAAMTKVVMTGRRMNGSAIFIADSLTSLRRGFDLDFNSGDQAKLSVCDDRFAGLNSLGSHRVGPQRACHFNRTRFRGLVGLDHEHKIAALPGLHRLGWNHRCVFLLGQTKRDSGALSWPQALVCA